VLRDRTGVDLQNLLQNKQHKLYIDYIIRFSM
jgi:hypothetical protein